MIICTLIGILISVVVIISLMQKYYPDHPNFPDTLKDWKFLPIYFRSLDPYDKFIMNYLCCVDCCSKVVQNQNNQDEVIVRNDDLNVQHASRRVIRFSESLETDEPQRNVEKDCDDIIIEKIEEKEETSAPKKHIKFCLDNLKHDGDSFKEIKEEQDEEEEEKEISIKNENETVSVKDSSDTTNKDEKQSTVVIENEEIIGESKKMHPIKSKKTYFINKSFETEKF